MGQPKKQPRKAVSFTKFRRLQQTAFDDLMSCLWRCDGVSDDAKLIAWACSNALASSRFADAVALARTLSEQQYGDVESYRLGAQLVALVKKVPFKDSSLDPEKRAVEKFLLAEDSCADSNVVLKELRLLQQGLLPAGCAYDDDAITMCRLIKRAQAHVARVLGKKPPMTRIQQKCRFSSGSNVGVHGEITHLLRKLSVEKWTVTRLAVPYARAAAMQIPAFWYALGLDPKVFLPLWQEPMSFYAEWGAFTAPDSRLAREVFIARFNQRIEIVEYDIIAFVLKDADCHRAVGSQPLLNMLLQLGVGDTMSEILLAEGVADLREGQLGLNGPLAYLGSFCSGTTLATLDLKSASDTISREICRLLLPEEWYKLLNALRTPNYRLPDDQGSGTYAKFCAMGNGFCFPLETLIFWALSQAVYDVTEVPDRLMAVYGDDLIVYQPAALLLIELLECCGFEMNVSKSFIFGPFRESCGQDYFNGVNVRPAVLDEIFETDGQVYHFVNSLARKGYTNLAAKLRLLLPADALKRPYAGETTTALEVPWDEFMASPHAQFHGKPPRDEKVPFYHSWSWNELLTTAVLDETEYPAELHLSAALSGGTPKGADGYTPTFACRRKTTVRVRRVAHG